METCKHADPDVGNLKGKCKLKDPDVGSFGCGAGALGFAVRRLQCHGRAGMAPHPQERKVWDECFVTR